jgi:uncharacterized membrane protein (Fun14 family)
MVELDPLQLGLEVGGGGALGFIAGFAVKKVVKVVAVLVGLQLALFKFLETRGVIEVHWRRLYSSAGNVTQTAANATIGGNETGNATAETTNGAGGAGLAESFLSVLPVGGAFATGAFIGFTTG